MSERYEIDHADEVAVAAVGEPGQRVFLLHARQGAQRLTLKVEKQQVARLVRDIVGQLREAPAPDGEAAVAEVGDVAPDFVVGRLEVGYDAALDRVVVDATELVADDDPASTARLLLTRAQAAAMAKEGLRLVEGGRPPCPFCGYPLDRRGHVCPRTNGSHPPLT